MESNYSSSSSMEMERSCFVVVATRDRHFHRAARELKFMSYLGEITSTERSTSCHGLGIQGSCLRWFILAVVILFVVLALTAHLAFACAGVWIDGWAGFTACKYDSVLLPALGALIVLLTLAVALYKSSSTKIVGGLVVFLLCAVLALVAHTHQMGWVPSLSIMLPALPLTYLFHKFFQKGNRGLIQHSRWAGEGFPLQPELDLSI